MRQLSFILVAAVVALPAWSAPPGTAPLARISITPSAMDESKGGTVDVVEVFPEMTADSGAHLLSIANFAPGLTLTQRMEDLVVTDDQGPVTLTPNKAEAPDSWDTTRKVSGTLTIRYRLPIVNDTHATGGPQGSPRIDGDGISSVGEMLLMHPRDLAPVSRGPEVGTCRDGGRRSGRLDLRGRQCHVAGWLVVTAAEQFLHGGPRQARA